MGKYDFEVLMKGFKVEYGNTTHIQIVTILGDLRRKETELIKAMSKVSEITRLKEELDKLKERVVYLLK